MAGKILVVDDSLTVRRMITDMLANSEWEIIEALDGNDGIEKLESNPDIALILSDINMPWMNGLEMVEQIKQKDEFKSVPICMLTTESAPESLEQAKNLGVNAYLVKPIQQAQLLAIVKNFLG